MVGLWFVARAARRNVSIDYARFAPGSLRRCRRPPFRNRSSMGAGSLCSGGGPAVASIRSGPAKTVLSVRRSRTARASIFVRLYAEGRCAHTRRDRSERSMRVLLVNGHGNDLTAGGAEKAVDLLYRGLGARGHSVSLLAAFPGGAADNEQDITVLNTVDWRQSHLRRVKNHAGDWLSLPRRELARAVAMHAPDIVHTHNLPGIGTGIWEVCRRQGIPVVHTLHDYYLLCPRVTLMRRDGTTPCSPHPLLCGHRTRRITRWSDAVSAVLGVSEYVLGRHSDFFPTADHLLVRSPMGMPHGRALRPPRETLRTVGYIGSLNAIKGLDPFSSSSDTRRAWV